MSHQRRSRRIFTESQMAEEVSRRMFLESQLAEEASRKIFLESQLAEEASRRIFLESQMAEEASRRIFLESQMAEEASRRISLESQLAEEVDKRMQTESQVHSLRLELRNMARYTESVEMDTREAAVTTRDVASQATKVNSWIGCACRMAPETMDSENDAVSISQDNASSQVLFNLRGSLQRRQMVQGGQHLQHPQRDDSGTQVNSWIYPIQLCLKAAETVDLENVAASMRQDIARSQILFNLRGSLQRQQMVQGDQHLQQPQRDDSGTQVAQKVNRTGPSECRSLEQATQTLRNVPERHGQDVGFNLLHRAASEGEAGACDFYIIAYGYNVNARASGLWTPLHWASANGHFDTVQLLLRKGADATLRDDFGQTAYDVAATHQIRCLLQLYCLTT